VEGKEQLHQGRQSNHREVCLAIEATITSSSQMLIESGCTMNKVIEGIAQKQESTINRVEEEDMISTGTYTYQKLPSR